MQKTFCYFLLQSIFTQISNLLITLDNTGMACLADTKLYRCRAQRHVSVNIKLEQQWSRTQPLDCMSDMLSAHHTTPHHTS